MAWPLAAVHTNIPNCAGSVESLHQEPSEAEAIAQGRSQIRGKIEFRSGFKL